MWYIADFELLIIISIAQFGDIFFSIYDHSTPIDRLIVQQSTLCGQRVLNCSNKALFVLKVVLYQYYILLIF